MNKSNLLCRALAAAVLSGAFGAQAAPVTVKIVGFNDFHGNLLSPGTFSLGSGFPSTPVGGADQLAGYVAAAKAANPNTIVVAAGDLISASPLVSAFFHDEGTIEALNRAGLDFTSVGNHEFDHGRAELLRLQNGGCHPTDTANSCKGAVVGTPVPFEGAKFKYLSANVVDSATGKPLFKPYAIKSIGGVRVGFIGMTLAETPTIVTPTGVAGLSFLDEVATVNKYVPQLRAAGAEAIVVLMHQGGFQDTGSPNPSLANINGCASAGAGSTPQLDSSESSAHLRSIVAGFDGAVDLVISGHTHAAYNCLLPNAAGRKIPVTSASAFGRVITEVDLTIDDKTGQVLGASALNKLVDRNNAAVPKNTTVANLVAAYSTLVSPLANQVIGSITQALPNSKDAACNMPAGDLIADSQLAATQPSALGGAEVAFMNPGGVRAGFTYPASAAKEGDGNITYGEAFTVQPFGNSLVTVTLSNQNLRDALEQQFPGCMGQTATRILLPSAGFRYAFDNTASCGARIRSVTLTVGGVTETLVDAAGVVQNPAKTRRVTINNFLQTGGDGFTTFKLGTSVLGGAQDIDALSAYLANFNATTGHPAWNPNDPAVQRPRMSRVDAGTSCPN